MAKGKASINELMGKSGSKNSIRLEDLGELLGDAKPKLPLNNVGRFRLVNALRNRFGKSFKAIPGVNGILKDFNEEMKHAQSVKQMKRIKMGG